MADIFRAHGQAYRATHPLTPEQREVMACIEACRTAVLGGHVDVCPDCGHKTEPSYNSCRNRHCPKCQALDQACWLESRVDRILPVPYFHVVFTLPAELKPLALRNRRLIYDLLFSTASRTLKQLGTDPQRLGALLGITAVLHTWTRDLRFHPHLHCIVTGGGLSLDDERWVPSSNKFLFPVGVIGKLYRAKFVAAFKRLYRRGQLDLGPDESRSDYLPELCNSLFKNNWVVYCKRPFAGPDKLFAYLGRYTQRVAISNHRLLSVTDQAVTFITRDRKTATLHPQEFIRRFLLHVLPKDFYKIRHYGLLASGNVNTKLAIAHGLVAAHQPAEQSRSPNTSTALQWQTLLEKLTGINVRVCPACGGKRMVRIPIPNDAPGAMPPQLHVGRTAPRSRGPP